MAEKSKPVVIASAVALTGTIAVVGNTFDTRDNEYVSLVANWSKHSDETLLTLEVQGTLARCISRSNSTASARCGCVLCRRRRARAAR